VLRPAARPLTSREQKFGPAARLRVSRESVSPQLACEGVAEPDLSIPGNLPCDV